MADQGSTVWTCPHVSRIGQAMPGRQPRSPREEPDMLVVGLGGRPVHAALSDSLVPGVDSKNETTQHHKRTNKRTKKQTCKQICFGIQRAAGSNGTSLVGRCPVSQCVSRTHTLAVLDRLILISLSTRLTTMKTRLGALSSSSRHSPNAHVRTEEREG